MGRGGNERTQSEADAARPDTAMIGFKSRVVVAVVSVGIVIAAVAYSFTSEHSAADTHQTQHAMGSTRSVNR